MLFKPRTRRNVPSQAKSVAKNRRLSPNLRTELLLRESRPYSAGDETPESEIDWMVAPEAVTEHEVERWTMTD